MENASGRIAHISMSLARILTVTRWFPIVVIHRSEEVVEMAEEPIYPKDMTKMTIGRMRNIFATGSIEILNLIILIRVLTSIIPVILTLTPISLTDPRGSTACTPELGKSAA